MLKEEPMKKINRYILVAVLTVCCICPINAAVVSEDLFPQSSGLSATLIGERVNIRNYPAIDGQIIARTKYSTTDVKIIGRNDDWYKIVCGRTEGWVYGDYVDVQREDLIPHAKVKGEEIVAYGMRFIGTPYVWGGNDLRAGVDCSGFTKGVFEAFNIDISRVSYMQATDGPTISKENLRIGDLVFFDTQDAGDGSVSHVGIYIGNDQFIHSDSTKGVMISRLNSNYYTKNYVKGVRIC